jgi:RNA-directed DNA polymerase
MVGGFLAYHAVPTNGTALREFRDVVTWHWRRALRRRRQRDEIAWTAMRRLADRWIPRAHILHPWPSKRFAVKHPRWEPDALIGPVRICAGRAFLRWRLQSRTQIK